MWAAAASELLHGTLCSESARDYVDRAGCLMDSYCHANGKWENTPLWLPNKHPQESSHQAEAYMSTSSMAS